MVHVANLKTTKQSIIFFPLRSIESNPKTKRLASINRQPIWCNRLAKRTPNGCRRHGSFHGYGPNPQSLVENVNSMKYPLNQITSCFRRYVLQTRWEGNAFGCVSDLPRCCLYPRACPCEQERVQLKHRSFVNEQGNIWPKIKFPKAKQIHVSWPSMYGLP